MQLLNNENEVKDNGHMTDANFVTVKVIAIPRDTECGKIAVETFFHRPKNKHEQQQVTCIQIFNKELKPIPFSSSFKKPKFKNVKQFIYITIVTSNRKRTYYTTDINRNAGNTGNLSSWTESKDLKCNIWT